MKGPRQWINAWQKEDLKRFDLVYHSMHATTVAEKKWYPVM